MTDFENMGPIPEFEATRSYDGPSMNPEQFTGDALDVLRERFMRRYQDEQQPSVAAHLARLGVNSAALEAMAHEWPDFETFLRER